MLFGPGWWCTTALQRRCLPLRRVEHKGCLDFDGSSVLDATAFPRQHPHGGQPVMTPPSQPDALIAKAVLAAAIVQTGQPAPADELAALGRR